jgi:Ser/Thr protein kinase RdoA (MazF antagonist)
LTLPDSTRDQLLQSWDFGPGAALEPIPGGLINASYRVVGPDGAVAVVQRLHPVFEPEVNLDLEAVTARLEACGLTTPRLLRTRAGEPWLAIEDHCWRALTHVEGRTVHRVDDPAQADSAGELVGRFHRCLDDFDHAYAFARAGVHDTAGHLARLHDASSSRDAALDDARALAGDILLEAVELPPLPDDLPRRHCHGDLKISNILFAANAPARAHCLIDLDTLGRQTMAYELGDALRSWCNRSGEDTDRPAIDLGILEAAMRGYARGAEGLLEAAEVAAIVPGLRTVCVELAARFCVDVFEDRYFGWDRTRFASRREHNLLRARGQLALARSLVRDAERAEAIVRAALG